MGAGSDMGMGLGSAIGGIAVLAGAGGKSGKGDYNRAVKVLEALKTPDFDVRMIPATEWKVFSEFFPEVYQAVVPADVQLAVDSEVGRESQVKNLHTLEDIADDGWTLQDRLGAQEAGRAMQGEAEAANRGVMRDMAQRGRLGGGEEMTARMMANQQASELANRMGAQIATAAMNRRAGAAQAASGAAGALRGQDIGLSEWNADYANRFNEMVSGRQNEAAQYAAGVRNQAGQERSDTRQRIGEMNAASKTDSAWKNRQYNDQLMQQEYGNEYQKAMALSDAYRGRGASTDRAKAAKEEQILGVTEGLGQSAGGGLDFLAELWGGKKMAGGIV